ncbi:MFS transporter [Streptomyces sp. S6]
MTPVQGLSPRSAPGGDPGAQSRWTALVVLCVSLLIVDAYALSFAGLLVAGGAADRFGRRRVFTAGLVVFGATSAWAAGSGSTAMLLAARAGMGVGAAMMMPATLTFPTRDSHQN